MKKIASDQEILKKHIHRKDDIIVDVGCGTGNLVRWMSSQGIKAVGIDVEEMIEKAKAFDKVGDEKYKVATGQQLPFENDFADAITYIASFHHIPFDQMKQALQECHRVLKSKGKAILLEPIAEKGSYYEIIKLVEDEADIQKQAYKILNKSDDAGLKFVSEEIFYLERSFQDYINLLNVFVESESERDAFIEKARMITQELSQKNGVSFDDFFYKSIARVIILEKK